MPLAWVGFFSALCAASPWWPPWWPCPWVLMACTTSFASSITSSDHDVCGDGASAPVADPALWGACSGTSSSSVLSSFSHTSSKSSQQLPNLLHSGLHWHSLNGLKGMHPYALQLGLTTAEWLHHLCPHVSQFSFDVRQNVSLIIGAFSQHVPQKSPSSRAALQQNVSLVVVVVVIVVLVVFVVLFRAVPVVALVALVVLLLALLPCWPPDLPLEALVGCPEELVLLTFLAEAFSALSLPLEFWRAPAASSEPFAALPRTRAWMASRQSSPRLSGEHAAQLGQRSSTCSRARPHGFGSSRKVVCSIDQRMRTLQDRVTFWWEHRESHPGCTAQARGETPKTRAASSASMAPGKVGRPGAFGAWRVALGPEP
mmetsp:Transcript_23442/g.62595  ORF Transcript_23442/g.62595 Transcript_23442/m.62595 type:complete len:371 (+) Transcript_23442:583-1695(+)